MGLNGNNKTRGGASRFPNVSDYFSGLVSETFNLRGRTKTNLKNRLENVDAKVHFYKKNMPKLIYLI